MVARAWTDPEYKKRLLDDGVSAIKELGISAEGWKPYGGVTGVESFCALLFSTCHQSWTVCLR